MDYFVYKNLIYDISPSERFLHLTINLLARLFEAFEDAFKDIVMTLVLLNCFQIALEC